MDKRNIKKIVSISVVAILVIIGIGFGGYKYTKINKYSSLIKDANKYMEDGEYDKAIDVFQQSLSYKNDVNVENSIKLAKSLMEVKKVYDQGIKLMNDKKYLEAIEQFKKIGKESSKLYNSAQSKIKESTKQYVALNISGANSALQTNKYDEANKYISQVFKVDNNNKEAKKIKETIDNKIQEHQEVQRVKEEQETTVRSTKTTSKITTKSAEDIVKKLVLGDLNSNTISQFDHEETVDGVKYFVIHVYDMVMDDATTGHTATLGWYYVNVNNGKVFDGTLGDLKPLN